MIQTATNISKQQAENYLEEAGGHVKLAIMMIKSGLSKKQAEQLLNQKDGHLREALRNLKKE